MCAPLLLTEALPLESMLMYKQPKPSAHILQEADPYVTMCSSAADLKSDHPVHDI